MKTIDTIILSQMESKEIISFLEFQKSFSFIFGGFAIVLAAGIYTVSQVGFSPWVPMAYILLRIFIVSAVFGFVLFGRGIYLIIISSRFDKGKIKFVVCKRPHWCANRSVKKLKGHKYVMMRCLWFHYALRIE